jgi:hypothetical protein
MQLFIRYNTSDTENFRTRLIQSLAQKTCATSHAETSAPISQLKQYTPAQPMQPHRSTRHFRPWAASPPVPSIQIVTAQFSPAPNVRSNPRAYRYVAHRPRRWHDKRRSFAHTPFAHRQSSPEQRARPRSHFQETGKTSRTTTSSCCVTPTTQKITGESAPLASTQQTGQPEVAAKNYATLRSSVYR